MMRSKGPAMGIELRLPRPKPSEVQANKERLQGPNIIGPAIGVLSFGAVMAILGTALIAAFGRGNAIPR